MKAPEKLYVDTNDDLSGSILYGFTEKRKDDDIEYIRKDIFIRKARKCFRKELPNFRSFMESGATFIKNFENFMQEE